MSEAAASKTAMQKMLDVVERVGNRVPHPVLIFVILIVIVIALSAVLGAMGVSVSFQQVNYEASSRSCRSATAAMSPTARRRSVWRRGLFPLNRR